MPASIVLVAMAVCNPYPSRLVRVATGMLRLRTGSMPLVLPLSVLPLKERPTIYGLVGVVVCVSGVVMVGLD